MAVLRVLLGPNQGQTFALDRDRVILGRHEDCEIVLDVGAISRQHAQVLRRNGSFFVEDLKSRNGTLVNYQRLEGQRRLKDRDHINICDVVLEFLATDGPFSNYVLRVSSIQPLVVAGGFNIPDYLAPEQVDEHPDRPVTAAVDLHAVGVMLYEMLLGESPLPRQEFEKLKAIAERRFTSAVAQCAERGFDSQLAPIIDRCLARETSSALGLLRELGRLAAHRPPMIGHEIALPHPDDRFLVQGLLFEDTVSEAYEAIGTSSQARVTLRLFKPSFNMPRYAALVRELAPVGAPRSRGVPTAILQRFSGGRARPLPVHVGIEVEVDRNTESDGCLCLIEEYIGNRTLMAAIQEGQLVQDEPRIAAIACQILEGLYYAHDRGAIHANLTPYCVFLGPDDTVKVEGFGLHAEIEQIRIEEGGDAASVSSSLIRDDFGHSAGPRATANPEVKLRALMDITQNLAKSLALDEVLPKILDSLFKVFVQADRGFVVLRETPDGPLIPKAMKHRRADADETVRISRTIVNEAMNGKQAILSADAANDAKFGMSESIADFRIRSMMCAPLIDSDGQALGVIQIDTLDQRARFQQEDLDLLASVASQAAFAVENAKLHETSLRTQAMERDLQVAHRVQQGFLPSEPPQVAGYEFFDYYVAANQVGGDYYDYVPLPDRRIAVIVADVAGKGISAALLMAKISALARYLLASERNPALALMRLNASFSRSGWEDRFVTLVLCVIDLDKHEVTIVNAGHTPPLLRHADGSVEDAGESESGVPLGVDGGFEYSYSVVPLLPGDSMTAFADGISEAMNDKEQLYGTDKIREQLRLVRSSAPAVLGNAILDDVKRFIGEHPQLDGMCIVCFGRLPA